MQTLKISEVFRSIQGEGRYQGTPATFIRLSGCTRSCGFCDTKYHTEGIKLPFKDVYKMISKELSPTIIFTGGEPLYQWKQLKDFLDRYYPYAKGTRMHLETNGDLIKDVKILTELFEYFNYVCISPKEEKVAKGIFKIVKEYKNKTCCRNGGFVDIKVVTDMDKIGVGMLDLATIIMPLSKYNKGDIKIKRKVWNYAVEKNLFYSGRLHIDIWGKIRKK